jgi:hypothetical protein
MTDFFSEELKYIRCIHTPKGMFNVKIDLLYFNGTGHFRVEDNQLTVLSVRQPKYTAHT